VTWPEYPAAIALVLSPVFAALVITLVPPVTATIYDGPDPAVTITQQSKVSFPIVTYVVTTRGKRWRRRC
jgi:hypothetical protein